MLSATIVGGQQKIAVSSNECQPQQATSGW
jgi:hypothetical protein